MARDATNLTATIAGASLLVVVVGVLWFGTGAVPVPPVGAASAQGNEVGPQSSTTIRVHVSGAVVSPGVIELADPAIVADAVVAAGGVLPEANLAALNLAAAVRSGDHIVVPHRGGEVDGREIPVESGIDLNAATIEQLQTLPGVGPVLAERILSYRTELGSFGTVEDLLSVPGIGEAKLALMRDSIVRP